MVEPKKSQAEVLLEQLIIQQEYEIKQKHTERFLKRIIRT
jgi:hypothetical protein